LIEGLPKVREGVALDATEINDLHGSEARSKKVFNVQVNPSGRGPLSSVAASAGSLGIMLYAGDRGLWGP